ncbi:MAG: hypothetical protein E6Q97_12510 [Desulfurellales bacterium]|nr:MAG: hypothetical protein E6Q97_12510 [Desulfurellales bacterium]
MPAVPPRGVPFPTPMPGYSGTNESQFRRMLETRLRDMQSQIDGIQSEVDPDSGDITALQYQLFGEGDTVTAGVAAAWRVPYALEALYLRASLTTASSGGAVVLDVLANGVSVFGANKLTIDEGALSSYTSVDPPAFDVQYIEDDAELTFNVTDDGTGAEGLKAYLVHRPQVVPQAVTVVGTAPAGQIDAAYSFTFLAVGGAGAPYTFSYTGTLPPGLTLASDGTLSGTPTTVTGSPFLFTVTAEDSEGAVSAGSSQSVAIAALWTPADLPSGLYAWYASDDPSNTYGGTEYFTLFDRSGNGRTASRAGNGPQVETTGIGGAQSMRFDGTTIETMQIGSSTTFSQNRPGLAALVVYEMDPDDVAATFRSLVFSATNAANTARFCVASGNGTTANVPALVARRVDGTSAEVVNAPAQTGPCVLVGVADYTNADGYLSHNGTLITDTTFLTNGNTSNTASSTHVRFGTSPDNNGRHKGLITDIVLMNEAPSAADRQRLEGWAAWARGLESLLDAGHPYKSAPPYA